MTDDRFFSRCGPFALGEIAAHANAKLPPNAPAGLMVRGIAPLDTALSDELSVFSDVRHAGAFANGHAGAIITSTRLSNYPHNGSWLLMAEDPRLAFALIGLLFHPRHLAEAGVHRSAQIDPTASIGEGCQIDSGAVIGAHVQLGDGCHIGANAFVGPAVEIGQGTIVGANATITHALIGARVRIGAGVVMGSEGFGVMAGPAGLVCSAQLGRVVIGDGVRVGSNCTIDRGAVDDTVIGAGTMIDNLVQIAHNVRIGTNCVFAGQAGVAGSTTIGNNVMVGGQVAISDHLTIGSNARIAGKSGVMRDVPAGEAVAGYPAVAVRQWHRQTLGLAQQSRKKEPNA
jgi:UDP-3-O-[3-hydroxymyristoyl] glucosamine N-acyltransferase